MNQFFMGEEWLGVVVKYIMFYISVFTKKSCFMTKICSVLSAFVVADFV